MKISMAMCIIFCSIEQAYTKDVSALFRYQGNVRKLVSKMLISEQ